MRKYERIDRIIELLSEIWHKYPDLRLGQLLYNFANFKDNSRIFYLEDDETEKAMRDLLARLESFKREE